MIVPLAPTKEGMKEIDGKKGYPQAGEKKSEKAGFCNGFAEVGL